MNKIFVKKENINKPRKDLLLDTKFSSFETEAYKTIRTSLNFTLVQQSGCKKISITSSVSKEGKSTICINLAKTVAQSNKKVLVLDCDLRKPRLHKFFKAKSIPGISNFLIGQSTLSDIIKTTDDPNLNVIYAGIIPPNAAELLASAEFKKMIDELSKNYDYIFMDCPPLLEVSDALEASKVFDGVVLITRNNFTSHNFINQSLKKLEFASIKVLGFILNDVPKKKNKYYYRYMT